jgi:predicted dinucleotide-binding enzyme
MKKVAIIGAGNVGATLGKRLRDAGHTVRWGVPDPTNAKYQGLDVTTPAEAAQNADIVFLAVPWSAAETAVQNAGSLAGKIVVDITNPIAEDFSDLVDLQGTSAAEHIARWAAGAAVVKAFNTIGSNVMENPQFGQERATLLVAADDGEAKQTVMGLAAELGFDPVDAGPLPMARHLESFAWIWITLATKQGQGRDIVFQLLHR